MSGQPIVDPTVPLVLEFSGDTDVVRGFGESPDEKCECE